jgi:hypothetical protein
MTNHGEIEFEIERLKKALANVESDAKKLRGALVRRGLSDEWIDEVILGREPAPICGAW